MYIFLFFTYKRPLSNAFIFKGVGMGLRILLKHALRLYRLEFRPRTFLMGVNSLYATYYVFFFYPHFVLVEPLTIKSEPNFETICI